jgi:hypothetical protein
MASEKMDIVTTVGTREGQKVLALKGPLTKRNAGADEGAEPGRVHEWDVSEVDDERRGGFLPHS